MIPPLRVRVGTSPEEKRDYQFDKAFRIGRIDECEVAIPNDFVSRHHAQVTFENGQWWIRDLHSANGMFVEGKRVDSMAINGPLKVRLGVEGPFVMLLAKTEKTQTAAVPTGLTTASDKQEIVAKYIDHYFTEKADGQPMGEHTMMLRTAFSHVQKKEKRKYRGIVAVLAAIALGVGSYAFYLHRESSKRKALAEELFYSMKSLDVDIAGVEKLVVDANSAQGKQEIEKYQQRRREMENNYEKFITALPVYDPKMSEQERLILRVARIFGECELAMPPGFVSEIESYISKWKATKRLSNALQNARTNGYTPVIARELLARGLPPQFFYLALQESSFDPYANGPKTYMGIAKGMWQFIPDTAVKYGLKIGPLADLGRADPADDRHHWDRETKAAAAYLQDLYSTDAQASGFLVMACYNWGERSVLPLVRKMPKNPRERNFWRLLATEREKIPAETYDYVFYIVSAAVIGENPRLFGFDFDNPLESK